MCGVNVWGGVSETCTHLQQLHLAMSVCMYSMSTCTSVSAVNFESLMEELADFEVGSLTPEVEEDETLTSTHTPHTESSLLQCPSLPSPCSLP